MPAESLRPCIIRPRDGRLLPVNARTLPVLFPRRVIEGGSTILLSEPRTSEVRISAFFL